MEWPYRRFLKAFDAFQRRTLCDEWRTRKICHISALHANSNWDDEKNDRNGAIAKLERVYDRVIARIWGGPGMVDAEEQQEEAVWNSPLMRAGRRAVQAVQPPSLPGQSQIASLR